MLTRSRRRLRRSRMPNHSEAQLRAGFFCRTDISRHISGDGSGHRRITPNRPPPPLLLHRTELARGATSGMRRRYTLTSRLVVPRISARDQPNPVTGRRCAHSESSETATPRSRATTADDAMYYCPRPHILHCIEFVLTTPRSSRCSDQLVLQATLIVKRIRFGQAEFTDSSVRHLRSASSDCLEMPEDNPKMIDRTDMRSCGQVSAIGREVVTVTDTLCHVLSGCYEVVAYATMCIH